MLVRFESAATVADEQAEQAAALARDAGAAADVLAEADEAEAWRRHEARVFGGEGTIVKLVVLPGDLSATLAWLGEASRAQSLDCAMVGRAGLGVLYLRLAGPVPAQASLVRVPARAHRPRPRQRGHPAGRRASCEISSTCGDRSATASP